ncbi:hypothetical protein [Burkholderia ubonensis]|uniref:hypothetical protein n=1 Tax=Burkholderia ubonensis TaxID=101571 RepID=UPI000AA23D65|nr:hypothetical protein [Burkholderia ubonensis]
MPGGVSRGGVSRPAWRAVRRHVRLGLRYALVRVESTSMWRALARSAFGHRVGDYFRPGFDGSMRVTPPIAGGSLAGNVLSSASSM